MRSVIISVLAIFATAFQVSAEDITPDQLIPGSTYDPTVPTHKSVLGYQLGNKISTHADTRRYFEALAAHAPDRIKLVDYGTSWQGRSLYVVILSSAENIANLSELQAKNLKLASGKLTIADQKSLIPDMPASLWLSYSIHGNEISSTDAAMRTAYHLLANTNEKRIEKILDNVLLFINPIQNPDGRDRFIHQYRTAKGLLPIADTLSAEHNEPWPYGRTNHYLFDLNRDWISLTQPEVKSQIAMLQKWYPQVFVDLHEMGGNSSYYFAPEASPFNPHLTAQQKQSLFWFGMNNARWFDKEGMRYFTRDIFDAFYPGYGASWPAYYGAIAMTYEQGSARGLAFRRRDGSEFSYLKSIKGHFVTSLATAETMSMKAKRVLANFSTYQRSAIAEGKKSKDGPRSYVFPDAANIYTARQLMQKLTAQGIEVKWLTAPTMACGKKVPAGTAIIDAAQRRKRMIRTLLERQVDMTASWVKEQERLRKKDYSHDIYDVTAWSMPLMFNVDSFGCNAEIAGDMAPKTWPQALPDSAPVAWLMDAAQGGMAQVIAASHRAGLSVRVHTSGFTNAGRNFPRGTLAFMGSENPDDLGEKIAAISASTGNRFDAINSSWMEKGGDFGGRATIKLIKPRIAMAWDEPTSSYSAGNTRFVIERQIGYPVTPIRTSMLGWADLARYDVLILPEGNYGRILGASGRAHLADWVSRGGVLLAQGSANRFLIAEKGGLLASKREASLTTGDKIEDTKEALVKAKKLADGQAYAHAIEPASQSPDNVPGVLLNACADQDHWLTAGVKPDQIALYKGRDIYTPLKLSDGRNILRYKAGDELMASGYLWEELKPQLSNKPVVMLQRKGRGYVVSFTIEPTFRAYMNGLQDIYGNALFLTPSMTRKTR